MKIEEKFNKRGSELVDVIFPSIGFTGDADHGIRLTYFEVRGGAGRQITMHVSPKEALCIAEALIRAAREKVCK